MTDRELATALTRIGEIEQAARAHWAQTAQLAEKDAALVAVRHATALRRSLESWIATRATRAALQAS